MGKEVIKLFFFTDDVMLYLKDLKNSTPKFPDTINRFSKVQDTKSAYKYQ
jgi:hypothetical protein